MNLVSSINKIVPSLKYICQIICDISDHLPCFMSVADDGKND